MRDHRGKRRQGGGAGDVVPGDQEAVRAGRVEVAVHFDAEEVALLCQIERRVVVFPAWIAEHEALPAGLFRDDPLGFFQLGSLLRLR